MFSSQHGFRAKRNCADIVYNLVNFVIENFDRGIDIVELFIKVRWPFDS